MRRTLIVEVGTEMKMKSLVVAAALCAVAAPVSATTVITYTLTGQGSWYKSGQTGAANVTVTLVAFGAPLNTCLGYASCSFSGSSVSANQEIYHGGKSSLFFSFDHDLSGMPTTNDGFTSGSVFYQGNSSFDFDLSVSASLKTLYVNVVETTAPTTSSLTVGYSLSGPTVPSVPEPASWAMMIGGFAILGGAMRRRTLRATFA